GDFQRAEQVYRELLNTSTPNAELYLLLGSACLAQSKLDDAVTNLRQAVRLQPDHWAALHNLGVALAQQRRFEEACQVLSRAICSSPARTESLVDLGKIYENQGHIDRAVSFFEQALVVQDSAELHNLLGSGLAIQGRQTEAVAHFIEALRQQPHNRAAHSNL